MTDETTAITILDPERAIGEVRSLYNIMAALYQNVLKADLDYGIIPGTGSKPTLLLPGMEKIMRALNAVPRYIERRVIVDYDKPLFHYEYECQLIDASTGQFIPGGIGLGLCTSKESAFTWRQASRVCPKCGKETIIKGKQEYGGGWLCFAKKGGCGAKFADDAPEIISQPVGRIENPDIFDQVNAIMKRAKKRALGDAVKGAAAVSEFFTVDLEDFVDVSVHDEIVTESEHVKPVSAKKPEPATQQADKPATPKNAPKQALPAWWNAVLPVIKDMSHFGNSVHAANALNQMLSEGQLTGDMTAELVIQAVKDKYAEKVAQPASDNLNDWFPPPGNVPESDVQF